MAPKTPVVAVQSKKKKEGVKKEVKPEAAETTKVEVEEPKPTESSSSSSTETKKGLAKKAPKKTETKEKKTKETKETKEKKKIIKKRKTEEKRELSNPCIQRIALKAGAHRINKTVYAAVKQVYNELLEDILYRSALFTLHGQRVIIKAKDVESAIKHDGNQIYPSAHEAEQLAILTKEAGKNGPKDYVAGDELPDEEDDVEMHDEEETHEEEKVEEEKPEPEVEEEPEVQEEEPEVEEEPEEKKKPEKKSAKKTEKKTEKKTTDKKKTTKKK